MLVIFTILSILFSIIQSPEMMTNLGWNPAKVKGKVLLEGEPVVSAKVLFVPLDPQFWSGEMSPVAVGRTDPRGEFKLRTLNGTEGAVSGRHLVFITTLERSETGVPQRQNVLPPNFMEEVTVPFFGTDSLKFDLKLKRVKAED